MISADFEMAWAFRYSKKKKHKAVEMGLMERENVPVLLRIFEKYNIPVTWATVGHLFLNKCEIENGKAHSKMQRPVFFENKNWLFNTGDWYQHDPGSDYKKSPAWYAPDLIDQIQNSPVQHEIGCHTFSHIDMTYKNCTSELAEAEIQECVVVANKRNILLKSMVFPGGTLGNFETLKKFGFTSYRKPDNSYVGIPFKDSSGLLAIPSSLGLDKNNFTWSVKKYVKTFKCYLDAASKNKSVAHFWFHPSMDKWYLENVFPLLMKMVDEYRRQDLIVVKTMDELTEDYNEAFNH
ncbi:MAG: polysaccharide deacetylase family protein [Bacteroidales bacterium]|nr:polysaccharide deacetylase family protein [Bacteroidales bacterium]